MNFFSYIHAVGTGEKGNRDLNDEEMTDAMIQMLEQQAYPEQTAAFLLGWRIKPETTAEFRAALKVCDNYIKRTTVENSLELGYPFDGKRHNPYIFPLVAKLLSDKSLNLVVSGDDLQPAKNGITTQDIAQHINFGSNLHYADRKVYFKELHALTQIRSRLGLRTAFNTVEKLLNPANSRNAIMGVFHKPYVKKYTALFGDRYERLVLVKGNEGTPEVFSKCHYWLVEKGEISEHVLDPRHYGIDYQKSWNSITLEASLEALKHPSDAFMKLAKLNAAMALFVSQKAASVDDGYAMMGA